MNAFIIAYNRLTIMREMCQYLADTGCTPIIIDNNSTYPPLLEWYKKECPYKVHRMDKNYGHQVYWLSGLVNDYEDRYYIVSDHDLDLSNVPHDYVEVLTNGLENNPNVIKSGLSLKIDDLPNNAYAKRVYDWEKKFWETRRDINGFYHSDVDTTLALYDRERIFGQLPNNRFFSAVRSPEPYTAIHLPWYNTKESIANNEEELYYNQNTNTYWSQQFKEIML